MYYFLTPVDYNLWYEKPEEYYDMLSNLFGIMLVKYQMTTSLPSKVYIKCEMICVGPNMWEMSIIKYHEEQLVRCLPHRVK